MFVHKILRGANAERYLPFALSRLRVLENTYGVAAVYQQKYEVDGYKIQVSQIPPYQYVRITSGGTFFEFFTSGKPARKQFFSVPGTGDPTLYGFYEAACIVVDLKLVKEGDGKVIKTKSRTKGRVGPNEPMYSPTNRLPQVQLADEPSSYLPSGRILYDSGAPLVPYTGAFLSIWNVGANIYTFRRNDTPLVTLRPSSTALDVRDISFDVPFWYSPPGSPRIKEVFIRQDADWPRANGIQTVKHPTLGTRHFGIYNDSFNQFFVFPLSEIGPQVPNRGQNVPQEFVKKLKPNMPGWAYIPSEKMSVVVPRDGFGASLFALPDTDWRFSHDGKKACAVVVERVEAFPDVAFFSTSVGEEPWNPADIIYPKADAARLRASASFNDEANRHYNHGPGLVEVEFKIEITGEDPDDFTASISLREVRTPRLSAQCTVLAGYCWNNIIKDDTAPSTDPFHVAEAGDLIVMDVERWYNPTDLITKSILSLKNLTKDKEIRAFNADAIINYNFTTMSFVMRERYDETETRTFTKWPIEQEEDAPFTEDDGEVLTRHFCASVWVLNQFREAFFPDAMTEDMKLTLAAAITSNPRDYLTPPENWVLMPLNDTRDWSDPELNRYRWKLCTSEVPSDDQGLPSTWDPPITHKHKNPDFSPGEPSEETMNFMNVAMNTFFPCDSLVYLDQPMFGWWAYTDEILNVLQLDVCGTFFSHPNGSWAIYNTNFIYNTNGMLNSWLEQRADTLASFDITKVSHCVWDRVHFVMTDKKGTDYKLDTTFVDLYNDAVRDKPTTEMVPITNHNELKATFDYGIRSVYIENYPGLTWDFVCVDLEITINGIKFYYPETGYMRREAPYFDKLHHGEASGGMVDLTLMQVFTYTPLVGIGVFEFVDPIPADWFWPTIDITRTHFASCTLIT